MTTLAMTTSTTDRAIAWHQLTWVVWRRYRTTLAAVIGVVGIVALYLYLDGRSIHSQYDAWRACTPRKSVSCTFQFNQFINDHGSTGLLGFVQVLAPGLVGAFVGAPIVARELETGTFRYAWTQGVSRMRWTLAMLVPPAIGTAVVMTGLGALVTWRNQPLVDSAVASRMDGSNFPAASPAIVGWALLGFALGVLAGVLWRRVLPALGTAIVLWFGVAVLTSIRLRAHYLPPLRTTSLRANNTDLSVAHWWTKAGATVSDAQLNQVLQAAGLPSIDPHSHTSAAPGSGVVDPVQYLVHHGYTQISTYQPDSRYWTFQWIEFGWLTALSIVLLAIAVLLVGRRSS